MLDRISASLGFPSIGHHRRFVTAIAIDAIGGGVFMPVSMLYFLVTTDLSLVQVGAAISLASAVALPAGPFIGTLVDRYGAKRILLSGNLLQAVGFFAYLVTDSFAGLTAWTVVVSIGRTAFWGSYGNIVAAISAPGERERWFGFLGALRNVGFAIGGLASGLAITIGTPTAYYSVVVANAMSYVVAFALLLAVPPTASAGHRAVEGAWGKHVVVAHAVVDRWTSPRETRAWATAAAPLAASMLYVRVRRTGHFMLRRAGFWTDIAVGSVLSQLGVTPSVGRAATKVLREAAAGATAVTA